jgi:hypothetical protein
MSLRRWARRFDYARDHGGIREGETGRDFLARLAGTPNHIVPPAFYAEVLALHDRVSALEAALREQQR